jgi:hypothetical protein
VQINDKDSANAFLTLYKKEPHFEINAEDSLSNGAFDRIYEEDDRDDDDDDDDENSSDEDSDEPDEDDENGLRKNETTLSDNESEEEEVEEEEEYDDEEEVSQKGTTSVTESNLDEETGEVGGAAASSSRKRKNDRDESLEEEESACKKKDLSSVGPDRAGNEDSGASENNSLETQLSSTKRNLDECSSQEADENSLKKSKYRIVCVCSALGDYEFLLKIRSDRKDGALSLHKFARILLNKCKFVE